MNPRFPGDLATPVERVGEIAPNMGNPALTRLYDCMTMHRQRRERSDPIDFGTVAGSVLLTTAGALSALPGGIPPPPRGIPPVLSCGRPHTYAPGRPGRQGDAYLYA